MGRARTCWGAGAAPERVAHAYLTLGLLACAAFALVDEPVRGWLFVTLTVATVVAGVVAVRRDRTRANPTRWLLAGAALLVPAYVLWYPAARAWDLEPGDPGITDALFLAAYGCFLIALSRLIRRRSIGERRVHLVDSLLISVGLGVGVWVVFISPSLTDVSTAVPAKAVAVSYTVINLLLFGAVVRLLVQGEIASAGDRLLTAWVGTQLAADLLYSATWLQGTFDIDSSAATLWPISFVLLGGALLHPTTTAPAPAARPAVTGAVGWRRILVLGPAVLVAPGVLVALGTRDANPDVVVIALFSAVLFGLVLLRVWNLMVDVEDHRRIQERLRASIEEERRRSRENDELLISLRERQLLADRLFRIQRKISTRAPLQDVLDAITRGAAELLDDDAVGLRLLDEDDPGTMVMVSSVGVPQELVRDLHRLPVGAGIGGRALLEDRLFIQESYAEWEGALGGLASDGLQTAMGAPVHLAGRPIGSLVVGSHTAGRRYTAAEQAAIVAFAEHVSLALNDARTVQAMHEALDRAVHQARHDELTGLPNRACFYERTDAALRAAAARHTSTAVLLLDLDRFKEINDTLGHRYGDRILRAIGPRLQSLLRGPDTLARLGGDEFCVLLPDVDGLAGALAAARRITDALEEPFELDGMSMVVEASCGVAVAPTHGETADLLLQRADVAMYVAKTSHTDVVVYEDRLDRNTPDRLAMLGELRTAIASDQLVLHFQPQVDLRTGAVAGVEALVRWQHPRRGLIGPDQFVPVAEDTGLIRPLTTWVLDAALEQLRAWLDEDGLPGAAGLTMAVNLSPRSLLDDAICGEVVLALSRVGIPAHRLVLEVTETAIMSDPHRAHRVLAELSAAGVRIAIDDFGTGYSSLAALKHLPVQHLKVDKSFVQHMHEDANDATIVRSVVELGRTLGLRTVAEGVEHPAAWDRLVELGCDVAQGYLLARPLAADDMAAWLRARHRGGLRLVAG